MKKLILFLFFFSSLASASYYSPESSAAQACAASLGYGCNQDGPNEWCYTSYVASNFITYKGSDCNYSAPSNISQHRVSFLGYPSCPNGDVPGAGGLCEEPEPECGESQTYSSSVESCVSECGNGSSYDFFNHSECLPDCASGNGFSHNPTGGPDGASCVSECPEGSQMVIGIGAAGNYCAGAETMGPEKTTGKSEDTASGETSETTERTDPPKSESPHGDKTTTKTIDHPDGTKTEERKTTRKNADGSTTTTHSKVEFDENGVITGVTSSQSKIGKGTGTGEGTGEDGSGAIAGEGCDSDDAPSCKGDPIQCAILRQIWLDSCSGDQLDPGDFEGQLAGEGFDNADDLDGLLTDDEEDKEGELQSAVDSGLVTASGGGSCPLSNVAMIYDTEIPVEMLCPAFDLIRTLILFTAYIIAGIVMFDALVRV